MTFLWMDMLWLLLLAPLLVLAYIYLLGRKKRMAVRYANLGMVKAAMGSGPGFRRHVPALLLLSALIVTIISVARPAAVVTLPSQRQTVILAMDVSGSMRAQDVSPNRIIAAQTAARTFIEEQPSSVRIGIVAFAGTAFLVQAPTLDRNDLYAAIERFQLQRGTAIGSGILISLATIFPEAEFDLRARRDEDYWRDGPRGVPLGETRPAQAEFTPVPPGSHNSAVIILLTDGQATTGMDPVEAARMAAERGVRVFTVGIGTAGGEIIGFEGRRARVQLDEETLRAIADITRGEYFRAGTESELTKIYQALNTQFVMETKLTEITALFSALAGLLALAGAGLSVLWFNRIL